MAELPRVSILIPTLNEEEHLGEVLDACSRQTYPNELIEVVVVDGGSTDGTRGVFDDARDRLSSLTWLDNPDRHQSAGLNLATGHSTGDVLVRWDAHAAYPDDYVEIAVRRLSEPQIDVVGGQWTPQGRSVFGGLAAGAMASRIGVGNDRYAPISRSRIVDTVSCGAMTRETFESVGGFDVTLRPAGEDADLMYRIRSNGGIIVIDPAIDVRYFPRDSPSQLVQQYYGYGTAKAAMLMKHGAFPTMRPLVPAALVACAAIGLAVPRWRKSVRRVAVGYATVLAVGALLSVPGGLPTRLGGAMVAPLMHIPYGVGVWVGIGSETKGKLAIRCTSRGD